MKRKEIIEVFDRHGAWIGTNEGTLQAADAVITALAALKDRGVVLEEAAKVVEKWRESLLCQHGFDQSMGLAQAIRNLKERV